MAPPSPAGQDRASILVVDDRASKLIAMEALFADFGENVVCVSSGKDALRQLLEREFAVILLDVNMPDMDGFETAALIRQRQRLQHIPIIFMTAGSDDTHALQGYSLGAVDYIMTPVVPEVLRTKVKVFVELYKMTAQLKRQAEERVALAEERARRAAAEDAGRRAVFLAEAGKRLVRSLDLDTTANTVLDLVVPDLAPFAVLRLSVGGGEIVKIRHGGEIRGEPAELQAALADSMDSAVRHLGTQVIEELPGTAGATATRGLACPLLARGTTLGVLAVAVEESSGLHDRAKAMVVEDLCGRAAIAIDNCLLYGEIQQRDLRREQFVAMLAHELRNPLGAITSAIGVLERVGGDPADRARGVIRRQVGNLTHLVDDLLDVARITTGKISLTRSHVDLAESVERCLRTLEGTEPTQHAITLDTQETWIEADPVRVDQILINLIGNALKYTPPGGKISIRVHPAGDECVFEIADTGVGMSKEALSQAFDLFFQGQRTPDGGQGGLGIGLSLARHLVELHGGSVEAASEGEGQGSRFTVRLPRSAAPPSGDERIATGAPESGRCRILLIEDNEDAREMLQMLLTLAGHDVRGAADGPSGIEMARATDPDMIVIDLGLPGMDGYEVARQLRGRIRAGVGLIALSGYGQASDRRKSLEAGFDTHLVKPVDPRHLSDVIASIQRGLQDGSKQASS